METFSALLALYAGKSPVTGEFLSQRPVTRSFGAFLICTWINALVNNGEAGDNETPPPHYDVIVMTVYCANALLYYEWQQKHPFADIIISNYIQIWNTDIYHYYLYHF